MKVKRWAARSVVVLIGLLSGCATRLTFDVQPTPVPPVSAKGFAKVTELSDKRRFEVAPRDPSVPSLQNPEELKNTAIASRTIGRQRGSYGNAMGNVQLPESRSVELVVREAVTKALAEQGYEVVDEKSPQFGNALPMEVSIEQFWAWFTPWHPLMGGSVEFRGVVVLKAEALTGKKEVVVGGYAIGRWIASADAGIPSTASEWHNVVESGVDDLMKNLGAVIKPEN